MPFRSFLRDHSLLLPIPIDTRSLANRSSIGETEYHDVTKQLVHAFRGLVRQPESQGVFANHDRVCCRAEPEDAKKASIDTGSSLKKCWLGQGVYAVMEHVLCSVRVGGSWVGRRVRDL
jgi:hypothetical protein